MTPRRFIAPTLAVALAAASLALPGAALARGGGSGGGGGGGGTTTPTPTPTSPPVLCDYSLDGIQADGSILFSNQANDAGCVTVRDYASTLRLYNVALTPGWVYEVTSNGEGTSSRVAIRFTNPATGARVEFMTEFGKTVIK